MDKQTESREQFEKWYLTQDTEYNPRSRQDVAFKKACEMAWQASRESLVVELPERQAIYASGYGDGYMVPSSSGEALEYDETIEAIRAIGIRIKGEGV